MGRGGNEDLGWVLRPRTLQPREKVSSIDLEIDSLSSLLDDMTRNDPFKARVRDWRGGRRGEGRRRADLLL